MNKFSYLVEPGSTNETSVSANRANIISLNTKESAAAAKAKLDMVSLLDVKIGLLSGGESKVVGVGATDLSSYAYDVKTIAHFYALISWLREGIKCKERMTEELDDMGVNEYLELMGREKPVKPVEPERPKMKPDPTSDDIMSSWSIGEQTRYFELEAIASVCADFVGPNGSFFRARRKYNEAKNNPCTVEGDGVNTRITTYAPSVDALAVEKTFFSIDTMRSDANSEKNGMLNKVEQAIRDAHRKNEEEYNEALKEYNVALAQYKKDYTDYAEANNAILDELKAYKQRESERIKSLKIRIPNSLKAVYDSVVSASKIK